MISRFLLFIASSLIWSQISFCAVTQEEAVGKDAERSIVPYQRVFLPLDLWDRWSDELRDYVSLTKQEWEQIFTPLAVDNETSKMFEAPPEIDHLFLSARLDGSNLVSSSSRIRFTRGSVSAETYRLEPWSLAINVSRPGSAIASRLATVGNEGVWGHDRNGTPVISLHKTSVEAALQPVDVVFPWTLRSLATSKPTNLQFNFSLPRVRNSCLILSLPKQATIIDSEASITKIQDWGAESKRFGEWGEQTDMELNRLNLASDSRWLIELSGFDRCRFTISFEETNGGGDNSSNSLDYMVLENNTEHEINQYAISSSTKLEIAGDRNLWDRPLRFPLPPASRIRSLTVAGREVGWRSQDGMIVILSDDLRRIPTTRESNTTVKVSYLTILDDFLESESTDSESSGDHKVQSPLRVILPSMQLERSFVVKGLTTIRRASDVQFAKIETIAKLRPVEKGSETTWEWSGYGPEFSVFISPVYSLRDLRAITKVTTTTGVPNITVRLIVPANRPLPLILDMPESWNSVSIASVVNGSVGNWTIVKDLQASVNRFCIYGGSVDDDCILDLQISSENEGSLNQIDFDVNFLTVENKPIANKLIIESLPEDWEIMGLRASEMVSFSQLVPEEKSFSAVADVAAICWLKNSTAISLVKVGAKQNAQVSMSASVKRIGNELIRCEYHIDSLSNPTEGPLLIQFESNKANAVTLRHLDPEGKWIKSYAPWSYNETDQSFRVSNIKPNQTLVMTADFRIEGNASEVIIPKLLNASVTQASLKLDTSLELQDKSLGRWRYDDTGDLLLNLSPEIERVGVVAQQANPTIEIDGHQLVNASYDLSIDGQGEMRVFWVIEVPSELEKHYRFSLEKGWEVELPKEQGGSEAITAWVDRNELRAIIHLHVKPTSSSYNTALIKFVTKRLEAFPKPSLGQPLIIPAPRLYDEDDRILRGDGRIWFPKKSGWKSRENKQEELDQSPVNWFDEPLWTWRPWHVFFDRDPNEAFERTPMQEELSSVADLSLHALDPNAPSEGWEELLDTRNCVQKNQFTFDDAFLLRRIQVFSFCIGIFLGVTIFRWSKIGFCFGIVGLFLAVGLMSSVTSGYPVAIASGAAWGGLLGATFWLMRLAITRDAANTARPVTHSTIWDVAKSVRSESLNRPLLIFFGIGMASHFVGTASAQDAIVDTTYTIPRIFIPLDSNKSGDVDQVFVPDSLLKRLRGNPGTPYTLKSAKHQLKLSARGMTVEGVDQLISTYEIYVNEPNTVIEIPFKPSLQTFSRLLVDSREVTVAPALVAQKESLTWTSEREGLRTIQVYQVPRWVSRPGAAVGAMVPDTRELELPVLPASNSVLEVDADPTVLLDVESQGAVLDKESGRYVVHLGAMPSIRGKVRYEPSVTGGMAARSQTDLNFDIELLLQSRTVVARTVLKAGAGGSLDKRITIEAYKMWEPIGSTWGNYRLVETRNGRLQHMRRYVFELIGTGTERAETESVVYWALADKTATEASLLFAECVEPVVRPKTLRFARVTSSEWNIELITNWIPAINETESLNWPELKLIKADQRATSLRVPQTGGGYLRRTTTNKTLQARIASRWILEPDRQVLNSRIEFFGASNTDLLEIELPAGFVVDEVTNRNAKVKVHQRQENGVRYAQFVAERLNWQNYDFSIRLIKADLPIETSMQIPWIGILNAQIMEQSVEVASAKVWQVGLVSAASTEKIMVGQGEEAGLATMMPGDQIRVIPRSPSAKGNLVIDRRSSTMDGRIDIVATGEFQVQPGGMAVAIVELPQLLSNRWRCDVQVATIACPNSNRVWLKIPLDRRSDTELISRFELSLSITPEEFNLFQKSNEWFRLVNASEVELTEKISNQLAQLGLIDSIQSLTSPKESGHFLYVENVPNSVLPGATSIRYWFKPHESTLTGRLDPSGQVLAVRWNGRIIDWKKASDLLTVDLPPFPPDRWNELEMVVVRPVDSSNEFWQKPFQLVGSNSPAYNIGAMESSDSEWDTKANHFYEAVKSISPDIKNGSGDLVIPGSAAAIHAEFWVKRLHGMSEALRVEFPVAYQARMREISLEMEGLAKSLPMEVKLGRSVSNNENRQRGEVGERRVRTSILALVQVVTVIGILLFLNSKRSPFLTLIFASLAVWLQTGLWLVAAFVLVVVCVVAIDTFWLNRLNRRLVR